jgi:hypothetical protein
MGKPVAGKAEPRPRMIRSEESRRREQTTAHGFPDRRRGARRASGETGNRCCQKIAQRVPAGADTGHHACGRQQTEVRDTVFDEFEAGATALAKKRSDLPGKRAHDRARKPQMHVEADQ